MCRKKNLRNKHSRLYGNVKCHIAHLHCTFIAKHFVILKEKLFVLIEVHESNSVRTIITYTPPFSSLSITMLCDLFWSCKIFYESIQ